jgi:hypothetical protein
MKKKLVDFSDQEICGVNLYMGDGTRVSCEKEKVVITRKEHTCMLCEKTFPPKTRMRKDTYLNEEVGEFATQYYCIPCVMEDELEEDEDCE